MRRRAPAALCALLLACAAGEEGAAPPAETGAATSGTRDPALPAPALPTPALPTPTPGGQVAPRRSLERPPDLDTPDIYMALQPDSSGTISVIFAIDRAKDNTPSDDPAIRLTPEAGLCNPQQLRSFDFPDVFAGRPIYSVLDAREQIGARELPSFLSTTVTTEMIRLGMAKEPDETRPQNICSFLLWQQLVDADFQAQIAQADGQGAPQAGQ